MENIPDVENKEKISLRILLADDEESNQVFIGETLEGRYSQVKVVSNGQELLGELEKSTYDIVVSDNSMPIMTGLEALKRIRSNEKYNNIPVIILTGDSFAVSSIEKAGGFYMGKPFASKELFAKIDALTQKEK